jgi:hypothetical protein
MGSPIDYTELVPGATVAASVLNANFEKTNTYISSGIPNDKITNSVHNLVMTWTQSFVDIGTDTQHVYAFKVPTGVTLTPVEIQLHCANVAAASVKANFYTAWDGSATLDPDATSTRVFAAPPNVDADNEIQTKTALRSGYTSSAASSALYLGLTLVDSSGGGTTGDLEDVTITLWAKADNRS